ncbi:class I SAM-dependent methyltransferase [Streptomyces sp. CB01881]|uniref:class I SAM-dependent methyltransferase n=1 Tax=Streptomyces sp. CB01881 TaxID=2078691 RepID=UPI000CDC23C3|nr:class I SAM-dependent methyltransferase [Streptomyces sp. CB01881]AUY53185.1 SAM-dependent methyltransferase [Streptomyces sp. CB01881]TYC69343.1 class I SAM-dependent methyltransferase [Streptomyces sp. CB01881]
MPALDNQSDYWNSTGTAKTFGHPLHPEWLARLDRAAAVLDYGCGYGRLAGELAVLGFTDVEGVDVAPELVARARAEQPAARFTVLTDPPRLAHPDGTLDAALLFAVLTCVPGDDGQRELVAELHRVLRPGGLLYVSDLCLQPDARNRDRYAEFAERYGRYGVFETGDGAVCRHHTREWLDELLGAFEPVAERELPVRTMNGRPAVATQLLVARP